MRVLILGGTGMLGHKAVQVFSRQFDTWCTIRNGYESVERFDIFDRDRVIEHVDARDFHSIRKAVDIANPDVIVNCIGIIKQRSTSKDVVHTLTVNSILPHLLAELSSEFGFRLVTISTDCVFSGIRGNYAESDTPDATDLYGRSKQYGEVTGSKCLTLRTSIIGRELQSSRGLIEWFLSQESKVKGYANAFFSGFPTVILAELIAKIVQDHPSLEGLYHISSDPISKYELLSLVKKTLGLPVEIEMETDFRIDRSLDSSRFRLMTGFVPLAWPEMVAKMLSDPTPYDEWEKVA